MIRMSRPVVTDWRTLLRELAITFVGVLLALLATAWWGERLDRKHELAYISQMRADLTTTKVSLDSIIAENNKGAAAATEILKMMRSGKPIARDTLDKLTDLPWFQSTRPTITLGTARALAQSGEGALIRDPSLRLLIASYVATADNALTSMEGYAQVFRPVSDRFRAYSEREVSPEMNGWKDSVTRVVTARTIIRNARDAEYRAMLASFIGWRLASVRRMVEIRVSGDSLLARLPAT
ncbi:MAG: hypothetical protein H0W63_04325 [Gemmatimonadaceae bacterium]|nr:hypothetical protein [Gemmatimonadaceae bacterium]